MFQLDALLAISLLVLSVASAEPSAEGWTDPSGAIIGLRGSEIRIRCGVNGRMFSSSDLSFFNNTSQLPVNRSYVRNINESVIEMVLPNAAEQESMIVCQLHGQHGISYNDIKIGRKPEKIDGLKCLSHNWNDLNCSFEKPYNPVAVQYMMYYRIESSSQKYPCDQPLVKDPKIFWCHLRKGVYRRTNSKFVFMLEASNVLGETSQDITFDNFASIVPGKPEEFEVIKIMSDRVEVSWRVNGNLRVFPYPFDLEFSVVSESECEPKPQQMRMCNQKGVDAEKNPKNFTCEIPLKFANTWYDISVRMRVSSAPDVEEMWSEWSNKTQVKTSMRRPDHPPAVETGSFNIGPGGDVYIYWKHLPKCYQNGANYSYVVTSSNKQSENPNEIFQHVAIYTKDRINLSKDTTVKIRNINAVGLSENASTLVIPGEMRRLKGPTKIKKILTNGSYRISWSEPDERRDEITSYTVFWCVSKSELPNSCEHSIKFVNRSSTETYYELPSTQTINFAVAANSRTSTSGMVWARCTTANSNEIGKIKTIFIPRLASTEIEVEWKLECTDLGIVAGYELEYCPIKLPKTLECEEPEKKINVTERLDNPRYTLSGLQPYTTYKIIIRMFSNSTMGPGSDPLANTTLEAGKQFQNYFQNFIFMAFDFSTAPSEVRGLIARNIGNTSVELYWDPPEFSNGVLLFYKVWANGKNHDINGKDHIVEIDNMQVVRMNYTLKDLSAFTEYDIAVEACTKECSRPAKTKFKTTIGKPGSINKQPSIVSRRNDLFKNYTSATIGWNEPEEKGGDIDYYEFRIKYTLRDGTERQPIIKTKKKECFVEQLCTGDVMFYDFDVRAVNLVLTPHSKQSKPKIEYHEGRQNCEKDDVVLKKSLEELKRADPHGWTLPGPWTQAISHSCHFDGFNSQQSLMLVFMMVFVLCFVGMVFFVYRKYKEMKDILVQMPPGLEDLTGDNHKKGKNIGSMEKMETPDILRNVDNVSINCEDENGQLLKKSMNGSLNGADCSSSIHSESTKSDAENLEHEDEIEYGEFDHNLKHSNDALHVRFYL